MVESKAIVAKSEVFQEMERYDQLQIVAEAMGDVVEELVYVVQGQKGLSYKGVNLIAFYMGDIGVEPWVDWQQIQMDGKMYWSATVRGCNERYNLTALGTAEVPEQMDVYDRDEKKQKIPDGQGGFKSHLEFDRFCRRKALSMAQRNAKRAVMPEAMIKKWLDYFWDKKQGRDVDPPFKAVDADFTVIEKEGKKKREKKPKKKPKKKPPEPEEVPPEAPEETPQIDPDEKLIQNTLAANGLDTELLSIYKYQNHVMVKPRPEFPQDQFKEYDTVISRFLHTDWNKLTERWEIPLGSRP